MATVWKMCTNCGANNSADKRFCTTCGAELPTTASAHELTDAWEAARQRNALRSSGFGSIFWVAPRTS